mmetsp:Transcript_38231/g.84012  ORF Transcript_38231/g.84012 Transcript_38231/m.84012 type:complete len:202 (-) Transcript_38231:16-621(-)
MESKTLLEHAHGGANTASSRTLPRTTRTRTNDAGGSTCCDRHMTPWLSACLSSCRVPDMRINGGAGTKNNQTNIGFPESRNSSSNDHSNRCTSVRAKAYASTSASTNVQTGAMTSATTSAGMSDSASDSTSDSGSDSGSDSVKAIQFPFDMNGAKLKRPATDFEAGTPPAGEAKVQTSRDASPNFRKHDEHFGLFLPSLPW